MLSSQAQTRTLVTPAAPHLRFVGAVRLNSAARWGFPEVFIASQSVLPALLYLPGAQPLRVPIRIAPFMVSLLALVWYSRKQSTAAVNPSSWKWLVICVAYLAIMIFHPHTNSLIAGVAQTLLYLSVLAPIFWASKLKYTPERVQRLLWIILLCSGVNALVGVLQVHDPETWMPRDLSSVLVNLEGGVEAVSYTRADGTRVIRPPGLSDSPGAVCGPASTAAVLGLIFFFGNWTPWKRAIALLFAVAGFSAVFLSQVRTSLLMACGSLIVYVALLAIQKQQKKALFLMTLTGLVISGAFAGALVLGGDVVQERFSSLFAADPVTVYYSAARGGHLEEGLTETLIRYPAGAGLGRWGMMRYYFGDEMNPDSPLIWAELQPNAWILDGGLILLLFYPVALIAATCTQIRIARLARSADLRLVAATVIAVNATALGLVFGYTPFTTQVGLQYWFISGVLHSAAFQSAV
jgi:hypothetical protein